MCSILFSSGQTSINEITDKNIQHRVLLIRFRTDSLLKKTSNKNVFKLFTADFKVTYQQGEFYRNYLFLNMDERDPNNIYDLTQYYYFSDTALHLNDTIGVYYLELMHWPETYSLEVRFKSNDDYLKVQALNHLYQPATQEKLRQLIKSRKITEPYIKIAVNGKSKTYFVFLKDKDKPHNLVL